mgnify:CR=1 FL=1
MTAENAITTEKIIEAIARRIIWGDWIPASPDGTPRDFINQALAIDPIRRANGKVAGGRLVMRTEYPHVEIDTVNRCVIGRWGLIEKRTPYVPNAMSAEFEDLVDRQLGIPV